MSIKELVDQFVGNMTEAVDKAVRERLDQALGAAFGSGGASVRRGPGRPPKAVGAATTPKAKSAKPYKRRVCPVPGCKGTAAPVFGMVCSAHKDVPKGLIKKYREAQKSGTPMKAPLKAKAKTKAKVKAPKAVAKKPAPKKPAPKAKVKKPVPKKAKPAAKKTQPAKTIEAKPSVAAAAA